MGALSLSLLLLAAVSVHGSQDRHHDPRTRGHSLPTVCCSATGTDTGPAGQCCGEGWDLHCCSELKQTCCFGKEVVPLPESVSAPPQQASTWELKHWVHWLNITIVILVIALVTGVLVCCCRRGSTVRRLKDDYLYACKYGTVPEANSGQSHWNQPSTAMSQWVDFSQKPPVVGVPQQYPRPGMPYPSAPYNQLHTIPFSSRVRHCSSSSSVPDTSPNYTSSDEEQSLLARLRARLP